MMIARPTTTSAAATTMTKKAMTWPSSVPVARAKVTSVRFTELSISSTHMNTTMALRRTRTPTAPMVNRRSEEHTSELQSRQYLVCRLLLEKKKNNYYD